MDPRNYVDRPFAKGTPLNWRDDVTGTLPAVMMTFLEKRKETPSEQLQMVIAFLQYHIHAPCWLGEPLNPDEETKEEILALRELSLTLKTFEDVHQYIHRAMDIGIDPL
jgi:hypothetical protein